MRADVEKVKRSLIVSAGGANEGGRGWSAE